MPHLYKKNVHFFITNKVIGKWHFEGWFIMCVYVYINCVKNGSSHTSVKWLGLNCKKQVGSWVNLLLLQIKFCQVFWQQVEQVKLEVLGTIIQSPGDFTRKLTVPSRGPCRIISFITEALLSLSLSMLYLPIVG